VKLQLPPPSSRTRVFALEAAAVLALTAFLYWAAWVWPALPFGFGSTVFEAIGFFLPLASVAAVAGVIIGLLSVVKKDNRARAARILASSVAVIAGTAVGMYLGPIHKMERVRQAAASAMPLVRAIQAFERDHGRPPEGLTELVPRYIAAIPSTGMRGYSEWDYVRGPDARAYGDNSWVLRVHTGGPGINFDQLMYFPNQQYPEFGHGGWIERVGEWAYVHE
jgi:hypothetical protein